MDDARLLSIEYLNRIADHCPRALSTYLLCWQHSNDGLDCVITREIITLEHHSTYTRICNDLRALAHEGLLEFWQTELAIHVTLAGHEDGQ